jgi:hypothetical protein
VPTYLQLTTSNPVRFASGELGRVAAALAAATQSFKTAADNATAETVWRGSARDAARSAADRAQQGIDRLESAVRRGDEILRSAGIRLEELKVQLTVYADSVVALGWIITPMGVVLLGAPQQAAVAASAGADLPALEGEALLMTARIEQMVVRATEVDVSAAEQLLDLCAELGGSGARAFSNHLREHLFHGEVKYKNGKVSKIVGYHARPGGVDGSRHGIALDPATATAPDSHGLYTGRAVYNYTEDGAAKTKSKFSSFVPDDWSDEDASRAIYGAFHSRRPVPGTDLWEGTYGGVRIQGYLKPGVPFETATADDIATAFPKV